MDHDNVELFHFQLERKPGKSDSDRSLGSENQKYKRLKTTDRTDFGDQQEQQDAQVQNTFTF